jgi:hypothetical protein
MEMNALQERKVKDVERKTFRLSSLGITFEAEDNNHMLQPSTDSVKTELRGHYLTLRGLFIYSLVGLSLGTCSSLPF